MEKRKFRACTSPERGAGGRKKEFTGWNVAFFTVADSRNFRFVANITVCQRAIKSDDSQSLPADEGLEEGRGM